MFGRPLPSPASLPQTTPPMFQRGRLLSEPGPAPSLLEVPPSGHASSGAPRRCSAPGGLWGGARIPQVVVYPPEEEQEVFRMEDTQEDPPGLSGKYESARLCMVWLHTEH